MSSPAREVPFASVDDFVVVVGHDRHQRAVGPPEPTDAVVEREHRPHAVRDAELHPIAWPQLASAASHGDLTGAASNLGTLITFVSPRNETRPRAGYGAARPASRGALGHPIEATSFAGIVPAAAAALACTCSAVVAPHSTEPTPSCAASHAIASSSSECFRSAANAASSSMRSKFSSFATDAKYGMAANRECSGNASP